MVGLRTVSTTWFWKHAICLGLKSQANVVKYCTSLVASVQKIDILYTICQHMYLPCPHNPLESKFLRRVRCQIIMFICIFPRLVQDWEPNHESYMPIFSFFAPFRHRFKQILTLGGCHAVNTGTLSSDVTS